MNVLTRSTSLCLDISTGNRMGSTFMQHDMVADLVFTFPGQMSDPNKCLWAVSFIWVSKLSLNFAILLRISSLKSHRAQSLQHDIDNCCRASRLTLSSHDVNGQFVDCTRGIVFHSVVHLRCMAKSWSFFTQYCRHGNLIKHSTFNLWPNRTISWILAVNPSEIEQLMSANNEHAANDSSAISCSFSRSLLIRCYKHGFDSCNNGQNCEIIVILLFVFLTNCWKWWNQLRHGTKNRRVNVCWLLLAIRQEGCPDRLLTMAKMTQIIRTNRPHPETGSFADISTTKALLNRANGNQRIKQCHHRRVFSGGCYAGPVLARVRLAACMTSFRAQTQRN